MNEKELQTKTKYACNRWFTFAILVLGAGTIFKLSSLKDAFYIPMQQYMGLNHTQIGMALSTYGMVQTVGLIFSIYLSDRFSKKYMISFSLIGVGLVGIYLSTFPPYAGFLAAFAVLAIFGEVIYWPVLLKAVRLIATEKEQGRIFGFLEAGRGIVDTIVAFSALAIFSAMGESAQGLKAGILFFSAVVIVVGIISFFTVPHDEIKEVNESGEKIGKNAAAFQGMINAIKMKEIWVVAFTIFSVYCVYCGLTYFIPFLSDVYAMPATLVGAYGIINQYGLKMVGGPVGGFLADKVTKSTAKYIRAAFVVAAIAMTVIIFLPHESMSIYTGMSLTLGFGAIIFTMRAVFFAPMDEIKVPKEISGAAMSIGSLVGYFPSTFAYTLYGSMLDKSPGLPGYKMVFMTMVGFSILGFFISSYLVRVIKRKQTKDAR